MKKIAIVLTGICFLSACSSKKDSKSAANCTPNAMIESVSVYETEASGLNPDNTVVSPEGAKEIETMSSNLIYTLDGKLLQEDSNLPDDGKTNPEEKLEKEDAIVYDFSRMMLTQDGDRVSFSQDAELSAKYGTEVYRINERQAIAAATKAIANDPKMSEVDSVMKVCSIDKFDGTFLMNFTKTKVTSTSRTKIKVQMNADALKAMKGEASDMDDSDLEDLVDEEIPAVLDLAL